MNGTDDLISRVAPIEDKRLKIKNWLFFLLPIAGGILGYTVYSIIPPALLCGSSDGLGGALEGCVIGNAIGGSFLMQGGIILGILASVVIAILNREKNAVDVTTTSTNTRPPVMSLAFARIGLSLLALKIIEALVSAIEVHSHGLSSFYQFVAILPVVAYTIMLVGLWQYKKWVVPLLFITVLVDGLSGFGGLGIIWSLLFSLPSLASVILLVVWLFQRKYFSGEYLSAKTMLIQILYLLAYLYPILELSGVLAELKAVYF